MTCNAGNSLYMEVASLEVASLHDLKKVHCDCLLQGILRVLLVYSKILSHHISSKFSHADLLHVANGG